MWILHWMSNTVLNSLDKLSNRKRLGLRLFSLGTKWKDFILSNAGDLSQILICSDCFSFPKKFSKYDNITAKWFHINAPQRQNYICKYNCLKKICLTHFSENKRHIVFFPYVNFSDVYFSLFNQDLTSVRLIKLEKKTKLCTWSRGNKTNLIDKPKGDFNHPNRLRVCYG